MLSTVVRELAENAFICVTRTKPGLVKGISLVQFEETHRMNSEVHSPKEEHVEEEKPKQEKEPEVCVRNIRIGKRFDIASLKVVRFRLPESFITHREEWVDIRRMDNW